MQCLVIDKCVLSPYFIELSAPYGCWERTDRTRVMYISPFLYAHQLPIHNTVRVSPAVGGRVERATGGGQDGLGLASLDIIT